MARGKVTLPDGRIVSAVGPEYRDFLAAHPDFRKSSGTSKPRSQPKDSDSPAFLGFEPPPELEGEPDRVDPARSSTPPPRKGSASETKAKDKADDVSDLCDILATLYSGIAVATQFQEWQISKDEAERIARPAQRILARHKHLEKTVRNFTDPAALIGAVLITTGTRYAMWQQHLKMKQAQAYNAAPVNNVETHARADQPQAQAPPPPRARVEDVISRIAGMDG
jgi:hypothetical protein